MTIIESAVLSGIPTGAIIGGAIGKAYGVLGVVGGALAGMVLGAVAGFLYSVLIIGLLAIVDMFWRGRCKVENLEPSDAAYKLMRSTCIRGAFFGTVAAAFCWFAFGWVSALLVALAAGAIAAFIAVGQSVPRPKKEQA